MWTDYFPSLQPDQDGQAKVLCPFHEDTEPSLSINVRKNIFCCFGCGAKGTFEDFQKLLHPGMEISTFKQKGGMKSRSPSYIKSEIVETHHKALLENEEWIEYLQKEKGWTLEIIERFRLGLKEDRIAIPIFDIQERCYNIASYKPQAKQGEEKILSIKGYGQTRIFPEKNLLLKDEIALLFLEGLPDCILANALGYPAITLTNGASAKLPEEYLKFFARKEVNICYDLDEAGEKGSKELRRTLRPFARKITDIHLPEELGKGGDFTDFFLSERTKKDFDTLFENSIIDVTLENLTHAQFMGQRVRVLGKLAGKDEIPFLIPSAFIFSCKNRGKSKKCGYCPLNIGDEVYISISDEDEINLQLIQASAAQAKSALLNWLNISRTCRGAVNYEIVEARNVEGFRMVPEKMFLGSGNYVAREGFYLGQDLRTNMIYEMIGRVIPEPKSQFASLLVQEAASESNPLDTMNPEENFEALKIFQPKENSIDEVTKKIAELCLFLQQNITKIYHRANIIQTVNMVYFTPVSFFFQGEYIHRGWGDVLILGDSRQGKSKTVEQLFDFYGLGEVISGESSSIAGLRGGVSQIGKTWHLEWGVIPLNDRGVVAIDEAQNLDRETLAALSRIRSEGIAEIVKIKAEKTQSRTRLIFIANPKANRPLRSWSYPIEAISQFGRISDIARFDFVCTVGEEEITQDEIRTARERGEVEHKYPEEIWRKLILWAWSRRPKQILFSEEAERYILRIAESFGENYKSSLPIIKPTEERQIIAKYAASIAAQLFSTDKSLQNIVVLPAHAEFTERFFLNLFTRQSCKYDQFCTQEKARQQIQDEEAVRKIILQNGGKALAESLLTMDLFSCSDLQDFFGLGVKDTKNIIGSLVRFRAIRKARKGALYYKTTAFIVLLNSIRENIPF